MKPTRVNIFTRDCIVLHNSSHLAASLLPASLLVVHDADRRGEHDLAELQAGGNHPANIFQFHKHVKDKRNGRAVSSRWENSGLDGCRLVGLDGCRHVGGVRAPDVPDETGAGGPPTPQCRQPPGRSGGWTRETQQHSQNMPRSRRTLTGTPLGSPGAVSGVQTLAR
eukprot:768922-Prorocentrum_minimum.AAC.1